MRKPFIVDSQRSSSSSKRPKRGRSRKRPAKSPWPLFTLAEAFSDNSLAGGSDDDPINKDLAIERGLRSVAFLLRELSQGGNKEVDGFAAEGLGHVLENYADRLGARAGRQEWRP